MANATDNDIAALQTEIKQLRADIGKISGTLRSASGNGVAGMVGEVGASTERVWTEIKQHAQSVGEGIEARPIAAALAAFGAGAMLGLLLNSRGR